MGRFIILFIKVVVVLLLLSLTLSLGDQGIWLQRLSPECQDLLPLVMNLMASEALCFFS